MKKIIISLTGVLIVAGTVWGGECAWVVWEKSEGTVIADSPLWTMHDAFPTYKQCMEAKMNMWKQAKEMYEEMYGKASEVSSVEGEIITILHFSKVTESGNISNFEYRCYPDTVNPQEKR
jgi:hypothetical protein